VGDTKHLVTVRATIDESPAENGSLQWSGKKLVQLLFAVWTNRFEIITFFDR
jgi:hypothetical protein